MGNTKQALKQWLARLKHVLERSSCGAYTTLMSGGCGFLSLQRSWHINL